MPSFLFSPTSLTVLSNPMGEGKPKCGQCGLYKTCKSPKMVTSGKGKKKILLVGEAPGQNEDEMGRQFVGNSGQELEKRLRRVGINMREDCWLDNAVICRPPHNQLKNEKTIDYCRPNILQRIAALKPEVIVPLGGVAMESIIGWLWNPKIGAVGRWAGYQIPSQQLNAWICPTYHPSFVLREKDPVAGVKWDEHLLSMSKLKGRPYKKVSDLDAQCEPIFSIKEAALRLKDVKAGTIAFDYETNCLKPDSEKARIYSCSICYNGKWTVAFPWDGDVLVEMIRILRNQKIRKIASNAKFEDRWTLAKLKIAVRGWIWDTMLAAHALENATKTRQISSIKFQAFVHLGQRDWGKKVHPYLEAAKGGNSINRVDQIDKRDLLVYNAMDSLIEYLIAIRQMKEMGYVIH